MDLSEQLQQAAAAASGEALELIGGQQPVGTAAQTALGEAVSLNGQLMLLAVGKTSEAAILQPVDKACCVGSSVEGPLCADNNFGGDREAGIAAGDGSGGDSSSRGERVDSSAEADASCQNNATDGARARPSDLEVALMMTWMAEAVAKESEIMVRSMLAWCTLF